MTPSQTKVYKHIIEQYKKTGNIPSARSISGKFRMTAQGMSQHYQALVRLGKLKKLPEPIRYQLVDNQATHVE